MSLWIITEVINKLNVFAYTAVTFKEKINGALMIPVKKLDIMTLTVLLLTFSIMIPGYHSCILNNAKTYREFTQLSRLCPVVNPGLLLYNRLLKPFFAFENITSH